MTERGKRKEQGKKREQEIWTNMQRGAKILVLGIHVEKGCHSPPKWARQWQPLGSEELKTEKTLKNEP